ncbi:MAG: membrane dipeptidase [Tannerella sp.]|jgi:microsomal dipeptidase-like Zn-dependent dipeptidase/gamma-glutamyl-gamma-aminobutyrate hydrolase PuuD|nr:membrane dipeptidase [Tannerella sp.]
MATEIDALNRVVDNYSLPASRPLIGISANRKDGMSCLAEPYYESVVMAGGAPVIVPVTTDIETLTSIVETLDGLIFSGGGDFDPKFLGEEPVPQLDGVDAYRDEYDLTLLRLAFNRQIPIMGICRGHQLINVAFGGTLYQDLPSQFEGHPLNHRQEEPREVPTHEVFVIAPPSPIIAPPPPVIARTKSEAIQKNNPEYIHHTQKVNSHHHQAVKNIAPGFIATATAPDGVNEAIEHPDYSIFSVQWHPEQMVAKSGDKEMLKLFERLINEAKLFRQAKTVHHKYYSIDSHTDTPLFFEFGYDLRKKNPLKVPPTFFNQPDGELLDYEAKVDVSKMRDGLVDAVVMAAYIPQGELTVEASQRAVDNTLFIINEIQRQVKTHQSLVSQVITAEDIRRNKAEGRKSVLIGIENGYAIGKDIRNVECFAQKGIVYITLSHNGDNDICDAAVGAGTHNGLSAFGKEVVKEMNRLGVMVDISHTSEKTAFDVLEISKLPIIASHSSVKALCNHPRNISDELLKAIAENGGVVQVCLYDKFLHNEGAATFRDAVDHICYIVDKVGINYAGIGSDFDGCDSSAGLRGINEFIRITLELLRRGFSEEDVGKIIGGNFLRVFQGIKN